jgi:hypothetical protein
MAQRFKDFVNGALFPASVCRVNLLHVDLSRLSVNALIAALRVFRFLVTEQRSNVQRLFVVRHLLPADARRRGLRARKKD